MKRLSLLACLLLLASCSNAGGDSNTSGDSSGSSSGKSTSSQTSESGSEGEDSSEIEPEQEITIKDGPILHAWDWSVQMVKDNLEDIEKAGYKNVQLSPLHPSKDKSATAYWWNLYQPQGFKVATGNENPLGNKDSLKDLTKEAEKHGINIIMDVVTNHLGGPNDHELDQNVRNFEPTIYNQNLIHQNGQVGDWNNRERVVTAAIGGYPDLQTDHKEVQKSIIRMLKEYIDCGVKGFRFDAAKHIETPEDDGRYRSDFWPNITDAIYTYGEQKFGEKPFVYGEILDNACINIGAYTKYISVTDSQQGDDITFAVKNKNVSGAAKTDSYVGGAEHAVLWAESHDTFENKSQKTTHISTDVLNLSYAIQISRKDSTALFFARPAQNYPIDQAPQVISGPSADYKSALVAAANKLHTDFIGGSENVYTSNNAVVNIRKTKNNEGALIADVNCNDSTITVNVSDLSDGEYTNIVDNKQYTVSGGKVSVKLTKGGAVLEKKSGGDSSKAQVSFNADNAVFSNSTYVNLKVTNSSSASYKIGNGSEVAFTNSTRFKVEGASEGAITITIKASNASGDTVKKFTVYKSRLADKNFVVYNVPEDQLLRVWSWNSSTDGEWVNLDSTDGVRGVNLQKDNYIIVKFDKNASADWGNSKGKTADFERKGKNLVLDYNEVSFS